LYVCHTQLSNTMERLTRKEEELMQALWKLERAFVKDLIELLPEPKPHYNTVSTVIRKLEAEGFVTHEDFGGTHLYLPKISKEAYLGGAMAAYFDNSYKNIVAFFAREKKITPEELKDILKAIEQGE
jgi:BlaI family transcriptional regulator, penicillinase repressor